MRKCPGCRVTLVVATGHEPGCPRTGLDIDEMCVGCGEPTTAKCTECGKPACGRAVGLCGNDAACAECVGKALLAL